MKPEGDRLSGLIESKPNQRKGLVLFIAVSDLTDAMPRIASEEQEALRCGLWGGAIGRDVNNLLGHDVLASGTIVHIERRKVGCELQFDGHETMPFL